MSCEKLQVPGLQALRRPCACTGPPPTLGMRRNCGSCRSKDGTGSAEMLSIAEEPDEAFKSPMAEETPLNPFEDDEPDEPFEHLSGRRATAVSFAPPTRARVNSRNPFGEDAWEEASLGSEDRHMDSGGGCSFGRASGGILPLPEMSEESSSESKAAERRAAVNAISDEKAAAAVEEAEEAKAEVQRLRRALISEEQACAEARADRAELEVAASGSDASDSARLRLLLSEEKAKSRALGEKALRSERHRQKLLEEMVQERRDGLRPKD
eukprot:g18412.t1